MQKVSLNEVSIIVYMFVLIYIEHDKAMSHTVFGFSTSCMFNIA